MSRQGVTEAVSAGRDDGGQHLQYLTFVLADEVFAIAITNIKEIIEYGHLTVVPMMPDLIRGVINLRGAVVPVIDLAARFGRQRSKVHRRSCIVIVEIESEGDRHDVGVVVDGVNEVLEIPAARIEPAPSFGTRIRADFIEAMGRIEDAFVIILDVGRVLSVDEMATLAGVAGQEPADDARLAGAAVPAAEVAG